MAAERGSSASETVEQKDYVQPCGKQRTLPQSNNHYRAASGCPTRRYCVWGFRASFGARSFSCDISPRHWNWALGLCSKSAGQRLSAPQGAIERSPARERWEKSSNSPEPRQGRHKAAQRGGDIGPETLAAPQTLYPLKPPFASSFEFALVFAHADIGKERPSPANTALVGIAKAKPGDRGQTAHC